MLRMRMDQIGAMKDRRVAILYGSQTGTAQDVAERVAREAKRRRFGIFLSSLDEIPASQLLQEQLVVFVCATTGQGDPPDNMIKFWKFILRKSLPKDSLTHLRFGVIGLGDSSYQKYNVVGKVLHKRLLQLGGMPVLQPAYGDEQHDLGHDSAVDPWLENLWVRLMRDYPLPDNVQIIPDDTNPEPRFRAVSFAPPTTGDVITYDTKAEISRQNPFPAKILSSNRLTRDDHFQDVRLMRIDLSGSGLKYNPGDVLMVQPRNIPENAEAFLHLLNLDPDQYIRLEQNDTDYHLPTIPQPCSLRYLAHSYFDFDAIPRRYFFTLLSFMAKTSELEREKLRDFATAEGQQDLFDYCNRPRRTTLEILADFPDATSHVTLDYLFDLIPQLQPRAFSIASAQSVHPDEAQLLMAVVKYKSKLFNPRRGVCSTWLSESEAGSTVPVWIKPGTISFPGDDTPVIMVGPGTGLAPFRSFIQHRAQKRVGNMMLFFGCRHEKSDYLCCDEWKVLVEQGLLTVFTAFSRDQDEKVYVQHRIQEENSIVREWVLEKNASFFIAGNSKNMPDAVREALEGCLVSETMNDEQAKDYVKMMEKQKRFQIEAWS